MTIIGVAAIAVLSWAVLIGGGWLYFHLDKKRVEARAKKGK